MTNRLRKTVDVIIIFALSCFIVVIFIMNMFQHDFDYIEEPKLIEYRVINVIKQDGKVRLIVEINQHHYLMIRSFDNVIFKHIETCPKCQKNFKNFMFSIYDGLTVGLKQKIKELENDSEN